ncbi:MAG: DUF2213 domain-containing protein [Candidatus Hatepunaea meridiana]|nr:DUF2213 domain-containing protein [Candidatus Hatepunaea meridiana]
MPEILKFTWEELADEGIIVSSEGVELRVGKEEVPTEPVPEGVEEVIGAVAEVGYPMPISTDAIDIVLDESTFVVNDDGLLVIPDVILAKEIVQDYDGKFVYKPKEEIEKMISYLDHLPITDGHPDSGLIAAPNQVLGFVLNPRYLDGCAVGDIEIKCQELIADIKGGTKREVSLGFQSDIDEEVGTWNGKEYSAVQRNIFPDHEAIVPQGRCSLKDGCGVTPSSLGNSVITEAKEVVDSAKKKLIDEITSKTKLKKKAELDSKSLKDLKTSLDFMKKFEAEHKEAEKLRVADSKKDGDTLIREQYENKFGKY